MLQGILHLYIDKHLARKISHPDEEELRALLLAQKPYVSSQAPGDVVAAGRKLTHATLLRVEQDTKDAAWAQELNARLPIGLQTEVKEAMLCGATIMGTTNDQLLAQKENLAAFGLTIADPEQLLHIYTPAVELD